MGVDNNQDDHVYSIVEIDTGDQSLIHYRVDRYDHPSARGETFSCHVSNPTIKCSLVDQHALVPTYLAVWLPGEYHNASPQFLSYRTLPTP